MAITGINNSSYTSHYASNYKNTVKKTEMCIRDRNSITIGVGSRFNLGNGYSMTVQEDFDWGEGYGNGSKDL